jgi:hypothetical protein
MGKFKAVLDDLELKGLPPAWVNLVMVQPAWQPRASQRSRNCLAIFHRGQNRAWPSEAVDGNTSLQLVELLEGEESLHRNEFQVASSTKQDIGLYNLALRVE